MNKKYLAVFITSLLGIGFITYYMTEVLKNDKFKILSGAIVMFWEMIVILLVATILYSIKETKPIGQGVFLGSVITLVIGFGVCSAL